MIEALDGNSIETLLHSQLVARIAYIDRRGRPCIVPIAYAYDGQNFYGYSLLGTKLDAMTVEPQVCVEVDRIESAADWCSVVVRGKFELLAGAAALDAVRRISERMRTVAQASGAADEAALTYVARSGGDGIAYRIRVLEKHGRMAAAAARA